MGDSWRFNLTYLRGRLIKTASSFILQAEANSSNKDIEGACFGLYT